MNEYITFAIGAAVIGTVFAVLWFTGNLARLRNYVLETREELRKCTWPTVDELKGHTLIVIISVLLLGLFTVVVDQIVFTLVTEMLKRIA